MPLINDEVALFGALPDTLTDEILYNRYYMLKNALRNFHLFKHIGWLNVKITL